MYIYMLPLPKSNAGCLQPAQESPVSIPTHDGGLEHTAAHFDSVANWLNHARSGDIVLYPPQFFLLSLLELALGDGYTSYDASQAGKQRECLLRFVESGTPPWTEKVISPAQIAKLKDGRTVMGLDKPGAELNKSGRRGEMDRVILVDFQKGVPRRLEVAQRKAVLKEQRVNMKL